MSNPIDTTVLTTLSLEEYVERKTALHARYAALRAVGKDVLLRALRDYMERNPYVRSISWSQYSPYFNDGDACTFDANTESVYINGVDKYNYTTDSGEADEDDCEEDCDCETCDCLDDADGESCDCEDCDCAGCSCTDKAQDESPQKTDGKIARSFHYKPVAQLLTTGFDNDDFEEYFGNHVLVTITPDGVTISDYDHD